MIYQPQGSAIGNLLRQIQEEKQTSPLQTPPQTEVGSPVRNIVQGGLSQVESPESNKTAVIRPELTAEAPAGKGGVIAPVGDVGSPTAPGLPVLGPSSGFSPVAPAFAAERPAASPSRTISNTSTAQNIAPSLGTKLSPVSLSVPKINSLSNAPSPKSAPAGKSTQKPPVPSPTPAPKQNAPRPSSVGQFITDASKFLQGLGTKLNPFNLGSGKTLAKK